MSNKKQDEELQSRREFFKKAAKAALPVVGAVVLSSLPSVMQASETGCDYNCSGSCSRGCQGSCQAYCKDDCKNTCQWSCSGQCYSSCKGGASPDHGWR